MNIKHDICSLYCEEQYFTSADLINTILFQPCSLFKILTNLFIIIFSTLQSVNFEVLYLMVAQYTIMHLYHVDIAVSNGCYSTNTSLMSEYWVNAV